MPKKMSNKCQNMPTNVENLQAKKNWFGKKIHKMPIMQKIPKHAKK